MTEKLNSMLVAIVNWHRRRTTISALSALSGDTLKDMGLHRSQIRSVATERVNKTYESTPTAARKAPAIKRPEGTAGASMQDNTRPVIA